MKKRRSRQEQGSSFQDLTGSCKEWEEAAKSRSQGDGFILQHSGAGSDLRKNAPAVQQQSSGTGCQERGGKSLDTAFHPWDGLCTQASACPALLLCCCTVRFGNAGLNAISRTSSEKSMASE